MATVHPIHSPVRLPGLTEEQHPQWMKAFRPEMRTQQLADDHQAWAAVTGTLATIVSVGLVLAVVTVSICLWG